MTQLQLVMLIDDDEHDNFFHTRALNKAGVAAAVHACQSVDSAIAFLRDEQADTPDLILLDINMPLKSGWDFLDEYEALPAGLRAKTVVVMLTSSSNPADKNRAAQYSALSGYVTKPLTAETVGELMRIHSASLL